MLNPKQNLTSFARVYQAKAALPQGAEMMFGSFAAALAKEDTVHESDASVLSQLTQAQSITCVEEVVALARIDKLKGTKFVKDLGLTEDLSHRMIESLKKLNPDAFSDMERFEKFEYTLGCDLDFSTPPPSVSLLQPTVVAGMMFGAPPPSGGQPPPPATVNLIDSHMSPVRDQGDRGTCVAFASMACLEYHLSRFSSQPGLDLSEQFQYWNMVTKTNQRNLISSYPLLASAGSCREVTWPYYGKEMAGNDTQDPAPSGTAGEAVAFRCNQVRQVAARDVSAIQEELRKGRLVGIGIPVYKSWFNNGVVRQYGNIIVPIAGEVPENIGHAITLVGYADDPDYAGGGYFIVRNSWDSYWATQSVFGPGYGTIPYRYISGYNWDAWSIVS